MGQFDATRYGIQQTNPITDEVVRIRESIDHGKPVWLANRDLVKITRLRLISDRGLAWWDVSYCYGQMRDGTHVRVILPYGQFRKANLSRQLVDMCKAAGKYGKALDIFNAVSTLNA
ncbi:hypothetical protein [Catellatospora sichuanensis]|uniref:hypothetical protein n=1 Tax=Catellatospora sichuanensis TaxID=1969805 RepID=UPI0011828C12|nr:hypothetical protein [Catellatospora sichuanensis]